jgi:hypothetical protein
MVAIAAAALLERSCMASAGSPRADFIATDHPYPGIQRLRAGFFGHAYDPHRHETYAIGVTEHGIQAFRYRGIECASTNGMSIVLHPDELHDGHAVAPDGFVYRMLYIDAALIGAALKHAALPFVADAVGPDPALVAALDEAFEGFPDRFTSLAGAGIVGAVADRLAHRAGHRSGARPANDYGGHLDRARGRLDAATDLSATAEDLEAASGLGRTRSPAPFARVSGPRRIAIWLAAGCSSSRRRSAPANRSPRRRSPAVLPTRAT